MLWVRVGDDGDFQAFPGLDTAVTYLNNAEVGTVDRWDGARFDTPNFHDDDGILLYWGGDRGNLIRTLTSAERATVESRLTEVFN